MKVTNGSATYDCNVAVKCENDRYIKLYDENGVEIISFNDIQDFSKYTISGGSFIFPCDCAMPIPLTAYSIGGRTIAPNDWVSSSGTYTFEINNGLISGNTTTCNILLLFAAGTELKYTATQEDGKIVLSVDSKPANNIVIDSIQITRV